MSCVFCRIAAGTAEATLVREWDDTLAIIPLNPVTSGHVLVLPKRHVEDATVDPALTGATMTRAAELAAQISSAVNLITSVGAEATQSTWHLHIHLVPRQANDGLPLPWTPQQTTPHTERRTAMGKRTVHIQFSGDVTGDIGAEVITNNSGPVVTGNANLVSDDSSSRTVTGDGVTVTEGDHHGGIHQRF